MSRKELIQRNWPTLSMYDTFILFAILYDTSAPFTIASVYVADTDICFIASPQFIASEIFPSLPKRLQTLSYSSLQHANLHLQTIYSTPVPTSTLEAAIAPLIPPSVSDSLVVYRIIPSETDLSQFLQRPLSEYIDSVASPPPTTWASTRADACEICGREWIPLSYHHLIPKEVHSKVLKRGWHEQWMLNSVAWLCRACHNFVHRMASNEELAKQWYSVDRILSRDDVQQMARWARRVRWKAR